MGIPLAVLTVLAGWWTISSYRQHKINVTIAHELNGIVGSAIKTIQSTQKDPLIQSSEELMSQPGMLATIVTVLVHKFGDTRLSMKDFMLSDEAYVSVYVDGDSEEIILSLNSNLESTVDFSMVKFAGNDDNTFH